MSGDVERVLSIWTAVEVAVHLVPCWLLWGSVFGDAGTLASLTRPVRMAALASWSYGN